MGPETKNQGVEMTPWLRCHFGGPFCFPLHDGTRNKNQGVEIAPWLGCHFGGPFFTFIKDQKPKIKVLKWPLSLGAVSGALFPFHDGTRNQNQGVEIAPKPFRVPFFPFEDRTRNQNQGT